MQNYSKISANAGSGWSADGEEGKMSGNSRIDTYRLVLIIFRFKCLLINQYFFNTFYTFSTYNVFVDIISIKSNKRIILENAINVLNVSYFLKYSMN